MTALYRRYRPNCFQQLVGQEHIGKILRNAVAQDSFVHAYLFAGPRGTGKTSAAKIMSRAVNCLAATAGEPCGQCAACRRALNGESMDILEIDAASNRGIDEIRDLRERVKYLPVQEKYKVYIIDEVHMLTPEAFNALLKTLEEPPAHILFILATTEPHKIPLTVLSRCQRFDFRPISEEAITNHLLHIADQEKIPLDPTAAALIARKANGGMRDAIGLLD
ncbi:MAG: DNA polymerase III subunit gamma/tau, partial [Clostridiales bacterium]